MLRSDDGLVTCPICSARVKLEMINTHMDNGCRDLPSASSCGNINVYGKKSKKSSTDVKGQWSKIMSAPATSKGKEKEM